VRDGGERGRDVELLGRQTVCKSHYRIDQYEFRNRKFDGGWSQPVKRDVFERGHAVGVLLYDPERDNVVLIEQFRIGAYAAGRANPWHIEVVAGIFDEDESAEDVARR
jgi:ADP-ribose pyrophosphatase